MKTWNQLPDRAAQGLPHRTFRTIAIGAATLVTALAVAPAVAMWRDHSSLDTPTFPLGAVAFGAAPVDTADIGNAGTFDMSASGAPVQVRIPGAVIAQVLNQVNLDDPPIFWQFEAAGLAPQSVGLDYTVTALGQIGGAGDFTPAGSGWGGAADISTLLSYSTMQIYPASGGGDCSSLPQLPVGYHDAGAPNVYVYPTQSAELGLSGTTSTAAAPRSISLPGIADAAPVEQIWCVAIDFINADDQPYTQQAWALGWGVDSNDYEAFQSWAALIGFPPSLPQAGFYLNTFTAKGLGLDKTIAKDVENWWLEVYPDPTGEPDVLISLDPIVTHISPTYPNPSDLHPVANP